MGARGEGQSQAADRSGPGLVLGTAGHIDHGKTALIAALTGVDTDRLPEEKSRGITIELGFAALDLEGVGRLSVVDVPGHEGLVRTMVAGATGIDVVLLVVAADESVMPQTREHVAICDLLGIDRAVVALTKADLVDEEMIELASEEVSELLMETSLAAAPILPVSARTGTGLDALREALRQATDSQASAARRPGPPRLPVDRIFAMRGFGTVVTGTLIGAGLSEGESVVVHPRGITTKIRGLQSHGASMGSLMPGLRCAVNLQGVEVANVHRGDVVTRPSALEPTRVADVQVSWLESAPPAHGITSVEVLSGTAERRARLAPIGADDLIPGQKCLARLHVEGDPLALLPGDRFIVRGFARSREAGATWGGGKVLDTAPPKRRRSDPELVEELGRLVDGDLEAHIYERIRRAGFSGRDVRPLGPELGCDARTLEEALAPLVEADRIVAAGGHRYIEREATQRLEALLVDALDAFHASEPMRPGMQRAALRGALPPNVPTEITERILAALQTAGRLVMEGEIARRPDHEPVLDEAAKASIEEILQEARGAALEPPNPRDWAERLGVSPERFRDLVAVLERREELVRAPGDLWFEKRAVDALVARVVAHLEEHGALDTKTYKTLIGTSRRTAMPLMELLDELHVTRRQEDVRVLRSR